MGIPIEELSRAGLKEVNGELRKVKHEDNSGSQRGADSEFQKRQVLADEAAKRQTAGTPLFDNQPEAPEVDGSDHPKFRVTATLRFSDRRRRDSHGAYETLADCLIAAARRLLDANTGDGHKGRTVRARKRRGNHPDRADSVMKPPF